MALQNVRSNTAHKRPTANGLSDGQIAINTNATSPGLFFEDAGGNIIKTGPCHVGDSAPNSNPATGGETGNSLGELWLDTTGDDNILKVFDGSAFVSVTIASSGATITTDIIGDVKNSDGTIVLDSGSDSVDATFSGDVTGNLTGDVTGNADSADQIKTITDNTPGDQFLTFVNSDNSPAANEELKTDAGIKYNPGTDTLTVANADVTTSLGAEEITLDDQKFLKFGDDADATFHYEGSLVQNLRLKLGSSCSAFTIEEGSAVRFTLAKSTGNLSIEGTYTGNGSGLTNLSSTALTGTINADRLPSTVVQSDDVNTIETLTQAEYNALTPDANTLYFITN